MSTESRHLGKYELRERLARGGQGEVWKAFDPRLRRYIAIKQLHADLQSDPDFAARFEREARIIASLHHPNIVQIHDFQLVSTPDSDTTTAYMVMDYIEGPTLADYIRSTARKLQFPPAADIVYIFTAISLAIDYAHGKGMLHRDIKPSNIILDQRMPRSNDLGSPILTDFGIAKLQGVAADRTTVLGTPLYVSPEQAQRQVGDKRSDLYSLGIILYEMTTGVTPFRGNSVLAILMQHFQQPPTPPALINPHIPPALSEVILKSIAKDPDARFPSASAMTIALAQALNVAVPAELLRPGARSEVNGANSSSVAPAPFTPYSLQASPPTSASMLQTPPARSRQRRTHLALIALCALVVAGSGLLLAFFSMGRAATSSQAALITGQVRFLSSPYAPKGGLDEVEISISHLPAAPPGERYYAWLQNNSENSTPIHWPLTLTNDRLSPPTYSNPLLFKYRPYLFLITLENANSDPVVANIDPHARLCYASLPAAIQDAASFAIQACPQGSSVDVCMS